MVMVDRAIYTKETALGRSDYHSSSGNGGGGEEGT